MTVRNVGGGAISFGDPVADAEALLIQSAQIDRQAARADRRAAVEEEQRELEEQAANMRRAAWTRLATGIVQGTMQAVQGVMTSVRGGGEIREANARADANAAQARAREAQGGTPEGRLEGDALRRYNEAQNAAGAHTARADQQRAQNTVGQGHAEIVGAGATAMRSIGDVIASEFDVQANECQRRAAEARRRADDAQDRARDEAGVMERSMNRVSALMESENQTRAALINGLRA